MPAKKTNKLSKEYGTVRITGHLRRVLYKEMQLAMEAMGCDTESAYISISIAKMNQSLINKKPSE